ncbi:MAG: response regulator [Dehalococcoidia bacterium]
MTASDGHDQEIEASFTDPHLLAAIRHDLSTPLNAVLGYSEMLEEEAEEQGQNQFLPDLQKIHLAAQQLLALIRDNLSPDAAGPRNTSFAWLRHALRIPLTDILGYGEMLQDEAKEQDQNHFIPDLEKICLAASRLLASIELDLPSYDRQGNQMMPESTTLVASDMCQAIHRVTPLPKETGSANVLARKGSLLIVDDDPSNRDLLARRLKHEGYKVSEAESGHRALEMLERKNFDLVLLDVLMPNMNGYQVLERLKSDDASRHIPIIMLSALDEIDSVVKCIELGAEDYLPKPVDSVLLRARISACLEKKHLRDQEKFYRSQLETANAGLEKRVEERVEDLKQSNRMLQQEILERTQLQEQLQASIEEMAVVDEVARIITSTLDIDQVYERFAQEMGKLLDFEMAAVNIVDKEAGTYTLKYRFGEAREGRSIGSVTSLHGSQNEWVTKTGQTLRREDVSGDPKFPSDWEQLEQGHCSSIMVPLIATQGKVIGTLGLRSSRIGAYGPREQEILERLAKQIAPAMENADLYQEVRFQAQLMDNVRESVVATDLEGRVIYWGKGAEELHGYSAEEAMGKLLSLIGEPEDDEPGLHRMAQALSTGSWSGQYLQQRRDGTSFWADTVLSLVRDSQGEPCGLIGIDRDITERKEAEQQFLQAQKMEGIGKLAGGVAHDFNNLLTPIIGYADMGVMGLPLDHPARGNLEEISKAAERAAGLTRQLLAFSRRQIIEPKIINLNDLITDMDKMLRRLIGEDIELVTAITDAPRLVKVDPGQVEQVVMNLVVNSRDAMPQGGRISIKIADDSPGETCNHLHFDASPSPYVMLSVSDTGIGMTEEIKAHIFEPFFTTKEEGKGTGLGLATSYGIVKQSGGHIEVDSQLGQGTNFKIYLPQVQEGADLRPVNGDADLLSQGSETVLVAEDEQIVRTMVATILQEQGYTVLEACSGEEALRLAQERASGEINLLLTDVVMPQMSGVELVNQLQVNHPNTRILFTSGYTDDAMVRHGVLDTSVEFLAKPFSPATLARKVREVLDK